MSKRKQHAPEFKAKAAKKAPKGEPDVLSAEIIENLEAVLKQFRSVSQKLAD